MLEACRLESRQEEGSLYGCRQSTTWTCAKTNIHTWKNKIYRENSNHIYKERFHMITVIGKWTSPQDLIFILISQLEENS